MKSRLPAALIALLLLLVMALAVMRPPKTWYPALEMEAHDPAAIITLDFLFQGRATLAGCEALTGNMARTTLQKCPQCRIRKLTCDSTLEASRQNLFGEAPLPQPSGRMSNGVVIFKASTPELALAVCQATQAQSARSINPVTCYAANTPRPYIKRALLSPQSSVLSTQHSALIAQYSALFLAALAAAWLTGWLILRYEHLHADFSHDHVDSGPQKYHTQPTPRIGGLAVMVGLLAALSALALTNSDLNTQSSVRNFSLLLLAGVPAFLGGLIEDVTKKAGVLERLLLTMLSGATAAWLLGAVLNRLDIPGIDQALTWLPFAVLLTSFAVGGIANAINIIDGYNGLAGGYAVIVLAAMSFVANSVGDSLIFAISLALAGALLGFLVWNWPRGKIFLGDGGAYLTGFMLAELSILIVVRNPDVSPWFPLLLLIYPIFETLYSIYRRKIRNRLSPGQPDNQHLHQLIHDYLIPRRIENDGRPNCNSRVAKYFWGPTAVLAILGSAYPATTSILVAYAIGFCVFYVAGYRRVAAGATIKAVQKKELKP